MALKRVLVTGGSRGIGRSIALALAQKGWSVAIHYATREEEAQNVEQMLGSAAAGVYRADLSKPENADALWNAAASDGDLHALVNNAGIYIPVNFADAGDETFLNVWRQTFAINFESPLLLSRKAATSFGEGGKILNVASRVGFRGEPGAAIYAASKAALINLTRSLAVELAPRKVGVFGIAPGWVDTAMARDGMEFRLPEILSTIPLGRMASPEDCAAATAFLLSDEAAYLSGQVIDINGASYFH
jgi:3-oxoacyl-[acyl-carrier protein] reductase